jgi:hypothetical protein
MNGVVGDNDPADQFGQHKSATSINLAHTALCKTKPTMILQIM